MQVPPHPPSPWLFIEPHCIALICGRINGSTQLTVCTIQLHCGSINRKFEHAGGRSPCFTGHGMHDHAGIAMTAPLKLPGSVLL